MASARRPLPPLVVIDHPDQPISPRQRAAWWHVAAALQRLEQQNITPECVTPYPQTVPPEEQTACPTPASAARGRTPPQEEDPHAHMPLSVP